MRCGFSHLGSGERPWTRAGGVGGQISQQLRDRLPTGVLNAVDGMYLFNPFDILISLFPHLQPPPPVWRSCFNTLGVCSRPTPLGRPSTHSLSLLASSVPQLFPQPPGQQRATEGDRGATWQSCSYLLKCISISFIYSKGSRYTCHFLNICTLTLGGCLPVSVKCSTTDLLSCCRHHPCFCPSDTYTLSSFYSPSISNFHVWSLSAAFLKIPQYCIPVL